jgi:hypothetical protein
MLFYLTNLTNCTHQTQFNLKLASFFYPGGENCFSNLCQFVLASKVARFFLVHDTKTGKNVPNEHKMYQMNTKFTK